MVVFSSLRHVLFFFFFNDTATTEIYTLSLHDALPIFVAADFNNDGKADLAVSDGIGNIVSILRSEEHTSELQSRLHLVCRLLLEKKKKLPHNIYTPNHTDADPIQQHIST